MKPKQLFIALAFLLVSVVANAQSGNGIKIFEVKFTVGVTQYRGAMVFLDDNSGKVRLRYYANGTTNFVEEAFVGQNTTDGIRVKCYNAVYPGTEIKYHYSPDNFYFRQDENGNMSMTNVDDQGQVADCYIRQISGYDNKESFLGDFDWKL
jgi:hypothetical protein